MSPAPARDSLARNIAQYFFQINGWGPFFLIVGIVLASWIIYLILRPRSLIDHYIGLVASCYPMLLGILGAGLGGTRYFAEMSWREADRYDHVRQIDMQNLSNAIGQVLLCLLLGAAMSCLFLLLNVAVTLIYQRIGTKSLHE